MEFWMALKEDDFAGVGGKTVEEMSLYYLKIGRRTGSYASNRAYHHSISCSESNSVLTLFFQFLFKLFISNQNYISSIN
jgi:hypothetical protein